MQASCSSAAHFKVDGLGAIQNKSLGNALRRYYVAEHAHDWKLTYAYRSYKFKNLVPFYSYRKSMQTSFSGWEMQSVDIQSIDCSGQECAVRIKFKERVNEQVSNLYLKGLSNTIIHIDGTLWKLTGGNWIVIDAGTRGHVPLNANLADN